VFIQTTAQPFPPYTHGLGVLLAEQIQGDMPQRHHIFRRMILADAATIVIQGHIERPMERLLTMPGLADHNHKGRSGPYQA